MFELRLLQLNLSCIATKYVNKIYVCLLSPLTNFDEPGYSKEAQFRSYFICLFVFFGL